MLQGQMCRSAMVKHHVCYARKPAMSRHRNRWQRKWFSQARIHSDESLHSTLQEQMGVPVQQLHIVAVHYREKEVVLAAQVFFDTADHHGAVGVANLLGYHVNGIGAFLAQGTSEIVGPIV